MNIILLKRFVIVLIVVVMFGYGVGRVIAQIGSSASYVPLIGITLVPDPLALPKGGGNVTYRYAVKSFLPEVALSNVLVIDNACNHVAFTEGDDNGDSRLDYSETWRYVCATTLSTTTESTAVAIGTANTITAIHKAYATVIVGSENPPPLVSIVNITKVAYPLSLPVHGGEITFTYKVNNPGVVPLRDVTVTDDKCSAMSGKLGDTNGNTLLDVNEVWVYTCTTHLSQTTTNTVSVTSFANGLKAVGYATITVTVDSPGERSSPGLPDTGANPNLKITAWVTLSGILAALIIFFVVIRRGKMKEDEK